MGEAKVKQRRRARILASGAGCVYCAGTQPATTIEHMPPIIMFDQRQRPKGLEFPTCAECNKGTSLTDTVAAMLGRVYPDSDSDPGKAEIKKLLSAVSSNVPGLIEEMWVDWPKQVQARRDIPNVPPGAGILRTNGPILEGHMRTLGAKLGLALHFEHHGSWVPQEGGVQSMYFTNVNAAKGELPMDLINAMPAARTLQQGRKEVSSQFAYSFILTEEMRHSVFYAVFRQSFAVAAVTALDRTEFLMKNAEKYPVTVPGDFRRR